MKRLPESITAPHHGLPGPLPEGEAILWQGSPDWKAMSRSAFHTRALLVYFAAILVVRGATVWSGQHALGAALMAMLWLAPLAVLAMAMVYTMAWLTARTTVYTITNKRLVMRIGVVLDLTLNLPFESLEGAELRLYPDGSGDLPVRLIASNKIAYVHLWPHARAWRLRQPEPMMRAVPNAAEAGAILSKAMASVVGETPATRERVAPKTAASRPALRSMATAS